MCKNIATQLSAREFEWQHMASWFFKNWLEAGLAQSGHFKNHKWYIYQFSVEVVGNIHEDSELLKGGEMKGLYKLLKDLYR